MSKNICCCSQLHSNDETCYIVEAILQLAKRLELTTVAEFVVSKEVFEQVKAMGFDEFQGFYFSKPSDEILLP